MKYGDISLVLCISTRLRLVTILSLLVKYLVILHADPGNKYKLGYVKRGSTAFKVPKDGCGVPSAARALLGPEGLLMR